MLVLAVCLGTMAIAVGIGFAGVTDLDPIPRILIGACCFFVASSVLYQRTRNRSEFHIHISGSGQIWLMEMVLAGSGMTCPGPSQVKTDVSARVMPATTIWPWLLLLRLQLDGHRVVAVPILPDCLPEGTFRALSVACRWLAARDHSMRP